MGLTPKKKKILQYIRDYAQRNGGVMPTLREIADHLGISTVSTIHVHLKELKKMGHLDFDWNAKRGVRLAETQDDLQIGRASCRERV